MRRLSGHDRLGRLDCTPMTERFRPVLTSFVGTDPFDDFFVDSDEEQGLSIDVPTTARANSPENTTSCHLVVFRCFSCSASPPQPTAGVRRVYY